MTRKPDNNGKSTTRTRAASEGSDRPMLRAPGHAEDLRTQKQPRIPDSSYEPAPMLG